MGAWLQHARSFRGFFRRWGMGGGYGSFSSIYDGVSPVAVMDRNYNDDEADSWGCTGFANAAVNQIPSVLLSTLDREAVIRRITASVVYTAQPPNTNILLPRFAGETDPIFNFRVFTPFASYDPVPNNLLLFEPAAIVSRLFQVPGAALFSGWAAAFPAPSAFSPPITRQQTSTVTPEWYSVVPGTPAIGFHSWPIETVILDYNDPPIRVSPFRVLNVQLAPAPLTTAVQLAVTMWWSERQTEELAT